MGNKDNHKKKWQVSNYKSDFFFISSKIIDEK